MDHPWRHLPIQGNICPTCSISHFPFCPPRPSFDQNPRFIQLQNDHSFQRPFFDPFIDNRGSVGTHRPFIGNQNDGFVDPRSWHRNPSLERDSYLVGGIHRDGFAPQPRHDHGSNGFASEELNMGDRNTKRMRVDEMGSGSFTGEHHLNPSRVLSDDARRLKLIRDHGGVSSGPPQGGTDPILGMNMGFNHETRGYIEESSVSERNFGNTGTGEHVKFDELWGSRSDMVAPKHMSNMEQGIGFGQYMQSDRNGFQSDIDHTLLRKKGGVHSQNEEFVQSRGQVKNPRQTYEHNGLPTLGPNNVEQARQSQGVGALHHEEGIHRYTDWGEGYFSTSHKGDLNQQPRMYQRVPHLVSDVPNENYDTHNLWQIPSSDSMSAKEPHYSHTANWQVFSGSSAPNYEQRSSIPTESRASNNQLPQSHVFYSPGQLSDARQSFQVKLPSLEGNQGPGGHANLAVVAQYGPVDSNKQGGYLPIPTSSSIVSENMGHMKTSRVFGIQPPLPTSPPPPLPVDPPGPPLSEKKASSSLPKTSSSLFPVPVSSSATAPSSYPPVPEAHSVAHPNFHNKQHLHVSSGLVTEEFQAIHRMSSKQYLGEGQPFPSKHMLSDKPKIIDASHLFRQPHRATRPDHIVIILRGLPGSGKSYLAKMLRDLEVENGGYAPRIHSMDDYFMTEVEKAEENEVSKSSTSVRGKKAIMKKVMEYCYEPEMEEAYRSSMLKAFKKTLEEGVFTFIIVDDRNLRVADFAQFWAIGKRSGYEVYLLEATYKDPVGCAARNVHGFTQDDIEKMAGLWEEAPSLYLQLDVKSLFHGDDLKESGIQEVDMDTGDGDFDEDLFGSQERKLEIISPPAGDYAPDGSSKDGNKWDVEGDHPTEEVKELGRSKWSDDFDEDDTERSDSAKGNLNALSGLIQAYGKEGKSVRWGDQAGNAGFSIGAAKKATVLALVIGPGAGYNLKSNPLPEENPTSTQNTGESRRQGIFQERLRAEHESFRAVFDKRRQRIGGLDVEEE